MKSKKPLTFILSPLRAGRGDLERTSLGSVFGDSDTVPPKVPLSLSKGERIRVRPDCMDIAKVASFCVLAMGLVLLTGCASTQPPASAPSGSEQVQQRFAEIIQAAETKDLPRLDSYHWYGPHFTKFSGTGQRLDAVAARESEHKGLSALAGLKLRADDLQIDVFHDAAVATFTMVATIQAGAELITKRERGTLVFVKHEDSWKIVHEHFSPAAE